MKEIPTIQQAKRATNWKKIQTMSEAEVIANAEADDDAPILTQEQLATFHRVNPVESVDVKMIRTKLHMTQDQFSSCFGFKIRTVQEWEQHRREPTGAARNFLRVIEMDPCLVQRALSIQLNAKKTHKRRKKTD